MWCIRPKKSEDEAALFIAGAYYCGLLEGGQFEEAAILLPRIISVVRFALSKGTISPELWDNNLIAFNKRHNQFGIPEIALGDWFYLGVAYLNSGQYREAIDAFNQAIRIKPDFADAHFNRGNSYKELGHYKEAIEAYKQAISIKPDDADAHHNLGVAYGSLDMHKEAIDAYKHATRIKPDHEFAHNNLGVTYGSLDMHKEAIDAFNQAIRIKPDFADAHYDLGVAYKALEKNNK